jgi:hypothetical protein
LLSRKSCLCKNQKGGVVVADKLDLTIVAQWLMDHWDEKVTPFLDQQTSEAFHEEGINTFLLNYGRWAYGHATHHGLGADEALASTLVTGILIGYLCREDLAQEEVVPL